MNSRGRPQRKRKQTARGVCSWGQRCTHVRREDGGVPALQHGFQLVVCGRFPS